MTHTHSLILIPSLCHIHKHTYTHTYTLFLSPCLCLFLTSGAIQKGVPTTVLRWSIVSLSCPVTPKSPNLTLPSLPNRMFAPNHQRPSQHLQPPCSPPLPLMSRWIFLFSCRYRSPLSTSRITTEICVSSKVHTSYCTKTH